MGKGYNNFMSKKAFHPGSHANQTRIREAEEKAAAKKKRDEELMVQYQKEQELFLQQSLVSKKSQAELSLSFMYNPPPGTSKGTGGAKQESGPSSSGAGGEAMQWKGNAGIKQEKKVKKPRCDSGSSSSNDEVVLTWTRTDTKAKKKVKTEK